MTKKVAVLFSGQVRNFQECYPYIKKRILAHIDNYDIFFQISKTEKAKLDFIKTLNPKKISFSDEVIDKKFIELKKNLKNKFIYAGGIKKFSFEGWIHQLKKLKTVNQMRKNYELSNNFKYDLIIRIRTDFIPLDDIYLKDINISKYECIIPKPGRIVYKLFNKKESVNDMFAILTPYSADVYLNQIDEIEKIFSFLKPKKKALPLILLFQYENLANKFPLKDDIISKTLIKFLNHLRIIFITFAKKQFIMNANHPGKNLFYTLKNKNIKITEKK